MTSTKLYGEEKRKTEFSRKTLDSTDYSLVSVFENILKITCELGHKEIILIMKLQENVVQQE